MKEKIPCGGFYYDTESIEFDNGIMKAKGGFSPENLQDFISKISQTFQLSFINVAKASTVPITVSLQADDSYAYYFQPSVDKSYVDIKLTYSIPASTTATLEANSLYIVSGRISNSTTNDILPMNCIMNISKSVSKGYVWDGELSHNNTNQFNLANLFFHTTPTAITTPFTLVIGYKGEVLQNSLII